VVMMPLDLWIGRRSYIPVAVQEGFWSDFAAAG
jgi:hypothetical protein